MPLQSFTDNLTQHFGWRKERCETFTGLVRGVLQTSNVQHHALLRGLAKHKPSTLKSRHEKIRRFFAQQDFDFTHIAKHLIHHAFGQTPKMHLILDRTNWRFGGQDINYLVLCVRIKSVVFPLFWRMLDHRGCSNFEQRHALLEDFKATFGFECIASFCADREFVGQDWIQYLCAHKVPFLSA